MFSASWEHAKWVQLVGDVHKGTVWKPSEDAAPQALRSKKCSGRPNFMGSRCSQCEDGDPTGNAKPNHSDASILSNQERQLSYRFDEQQAEEKREALGLQGCAVAVPPPQTEPTPAAPLKSQPAQSAPVFSGNPAFSIGGSGDLSRGDLLDVNLDLLRAVSLRRCLQRAGRIWLQNPADLPRAGRVALSEMSELYSCVGLVLVTF